MVVCSVADDMYGVQIFVFDPLPLLLECAVLFAVGALVGAYCVQQERLKRIEEKLDRLLEEKGGPDRVSMRPRTGLGHTLSRGDLGWYCCKMV